jgi:hypothetical protein
MSGHRRLAILLTTFWVGGWGVLATANGGFDLMFFCLFGLAPVSILWGAWWVWRGFAEGDFKSARQ